MNTPFATWQFIFNLNHKKKLNAMSLCDRSGEFYIAMLFRLHPKVKQRLETEGNIKN